MLQQRALFHPRGLFGLLYWYAVAPLHHIVFRGMLQGIRREALKIAAGPERSTKGPKLFTKPQSVYERCALLSFWHFLVSSKTNLVFWI